MGVAGDVDPDIKEVPCVVAAVLALYVAHGFAKVGSELYEGPGEGGEVFAFGTCVDVREEVFEDLSDGVGEDGFVVVADEEAGLVVENTDMVAFEV